LTAPVDPVSVALTVTAALDTLRIPHTIGGSLASSIAGEPRSTIDIDSVDEDSLRRAIRTRSSTNLIHRETNMKVDLFVARGTPLDLQQIGRHRAVTVSGQTMYVHPPEDILLHKLRGYRAGAEMSDRQWRDVRAIARVQGAALDLAYLRENAPILDVTDLLERALSA
jgi:hypothetical protein